MRLCAPRHLISPIQYSCPCYIRSTITSQSISYTTLPLMLYIMLLKIRNILSGTSNTAEWLTILFPKVEVSSGGYFTEPWIFEQQGKNIYNYSLRGIMLLFQYIPHKWIASQIYKIYFQEEKDTLLRHHLVLLGSKNSQGYP